MNQIQLNRNQIKLLREIGKPYANCLSFTSVHLSPTVDWQEASKVWGRINDAVITELELINVEREEVRAYLQWFDNQEKDAQTFKQLMGVYKPRSQAEKDLYTYLKLVQAFNFPKDIKKDE